MKQVLTVNNVCNKFFIMNNSPRPNGKPIGKVSKWFDSMKEATIAMFQMDIKEYTNIYDIIQILVPLRGIEPP